MSASMRPFGSIPTLLCYQHLGESFRSWDLTIRKLVMTRRKLWLQQ